MGAIQILKDEHRRIEMVLDALDGCADKLEQGGSVEASDFELFAEFFRGYADRLHHAKEEDLLFVRMQDAGFPRNSGPLAVMLMEHDQGRMHVGELNRAGEANLDEAERDRVVRTMRAYSHMLRHHIHKEDNILYPMAEEALTEGVLAELEREFERIHGEAKSSGTLDRLIEIAGELARRHAPGAG